MQEDLMLTALKLTLEKIKGNIDKEKYNASLYFLLNSKSEQEFMKKYKEQLNFNNFIKLELIENDNLKFSLNELKCLIIDSVIEFYEGLEEAS